MSDDWRRRHPAYELDETSDDIDRSLDRAEQDDYAAQDAALQQTADAAARSASARDEAQRYLGQMDTSGFAGAIREEADRGAVAPSSEPSDGAPVEVPSQASPHAPPEASPTVSPATPPAPAVETPTPVGIPAEDTEMQTGAQSAVSDYGRQGMAEMEARQPPRGFEPGPRFDTAMLSGPDEGMERTPEEEALDRLAKPERDAARDAAAGPLPSLDAGLPSEGDIRNARIRGGIGSALHAFGAMLAGLAGARDIPSYVNPATALEQRREQGLERRMQGKATGERERRAAEHQAEQDDIRRQELAFRQRQFDEAYRDRAVAQAEASRAHAGGAEARTAATVEEAAREQADFSEERSPESDFSRIARDRVAGALEDPRRAASLGHAYDDVLARLADDPPTLSARELEPLARAIGVDMPVRGRSGGGTGSGTGGGSGRRAALEEQFAQHARMASASAGESPEEQQRAYDTALTDARAMALDDLALVHRSTASAAISSDRTSGRSEDTYDRTHGGDEGILIMPGVHAAPGIAMSPREQNQVREQVGGASGSLHALRRLDQIAARYRDQSWWERAGAALNPHTDADATAVRSVLMAATARLEESGIIGPSDVPRIRAAIPDPSSSVQEVLGTLDDRLASYNDAVEYGIRAHLLPLGVSEEGIQEAIRLARTGVPRSSATHHSPRHSPAEPSAPAATPRRAPPSAEAIQRALEAASRGDR